MLTRRVAAALVLALLVGCLPAAHAEGSGTCLIRQVYGWRTLPAQPFWACARSLGASAVATGDDVVYGTWSGVAVAAYATGQTFWRNRSGWVAGDPWYLLRTPRHDQHSPLEPLLAQTSTDLNQFWGGVAHRHGWPFAPATLHPFDSPFASPCGPSIPGAFYCATTATVYYPVDLFAQQHRNQGDLLPILLLAHEWGHHIQAGLGILDRVPQSEDELNATCLAGVYARRLVATGRFATDDMVYGAFLLQGDNGPHGDVKAGGRAFLQGLAAGLPGCLIVPAPPTAFTIR